MIRNKNQIEHLRGERQNQLIKYWTKHGNFVTMYGHLYASIVDAKLATHLD